MQDTLRNAAVTHYVELSRIGQAFASPIRLRLLDLLRQAPRSVDALSDEAGLAVANVSQHLQQLKHARVVTSERRGQRIEYRLSESVASFFVLFRAFAEELLPELDRLRSEIQGSEPSLELQEMISRLDQGSAIVIDVRPREEYVAGHLRGACSMPLTELPDRLSELPKSKTIIATCRGPYCPQAVEAVALLRAAGFEAAHVDLDEMDLSPTGTIRSLGESMVSIEEVRTHAT